MESNNSSVSTGRGILTEYERECIAGEHKKQRQYESKSRVRNRIEGALAEDVAHLKKHDPELLEELREVVCDNN